MVNTKSASGCKIISKFSIMVKKLFFSNQMQKLVTKNQTFIVKCQSLVDHIDTNILSPGSKKCSLYAKY